jgi:hypothetical protein
MRLIFIEETRKSTENMSKCQKDIRSVSKLLISNIKIKEKKEVK